MIRGPRSITGVLAAGLLAAVAASPCSCAKPTPGPRRVEHALTIVHPGDREAKPLSCTLVQMLDTNGEPSAYAMWVDSVICRDKVCDVVKVRLHWDALGRYQRYEVAPGSKLTKLDHVPFTKADLAKLHAILADPKSPLREVEKESMTGRKAEPANGVDAVSSPTILTLKTAVILGAGYTCYDLWHWSNGLLTDHIRSFTGTGSSNQQLRASLTGGDTSAALLALEHLGKRNIHDRATLDAVIAASTTGDARLIKPALAYLAEAAPSTKDRDKAILAIFAATGSKKRLLILDALLNTPHKPTPAFLDRLATHLPDLDTYFEVHLFLTLMDQRNPASAQVLQQAAALLDHDQFLVSRRAYRHLEKHTLPPDLHKRVDAYAKEHEDRL